MAFLWAGPQTERSRSGGRTTTLLRDAFFVSGSVENVSYCSPQL
jgi:hypothetical protein